MRTIKFRGKRPNSGKWIEGYLMVIDGFSYILNENHFTSPECSCEVIPETVGQFTGLTDKNGKEIFEGDIYNHGDNTILYHVVWHDTGLKGKQINSSSYAGLEYWQRQINVIGNIYSNPELLK